MQKQRTTPGKDSSKYDSPRNKSNMTVSEEAKRQVQLGQTINERDTDLWNLETAQGGLTLQDGNWYELRVQGQPPEKRAYHSSFIHNSQ